MVTNTQIAHDLGCLLPWNWGQALAELEELEVADLTDEQRLAMAQAELTAVEGRIETAERLIELRRR